MADKITKIISNRLFIRAIILTLLAISLFTHLWQVDNRFEEPRRALVAIEMLKTGNYIVPQILGDIYLNKPPLYNWIIALLFSIFDSYNVVLIRLISVFSLIFTGLFLYVLVKKYVSEETAFLTGISFMLCPDIFFHDSIFGDMSLFYTLLVLLQAGLLFYFHQQKKYLLMFIVSYFFAALGVLTKGLPSIAFQGLTLTAYLFYNKQFRLFFSWKHISGGLLFLFITGAYFIQYSKYKDVMPFISNLLSESSDRATGFESNDIFTSVAVFPFKLFSALLPWAVFSLYLINNGIRKEIRSNRFFIFSLVFITSNILVYWLSAGVRTRYLYMFFPFFLVILMYFYLQYKDKKQKLTKWMETSIGILMLAASCGFIVPVFLNYSKDIPYIIPWSVIISVIALSTSVLFLGYKKPRIYLLIIFLIFIRLEINFVQLPVLTKLDDNRKYHTDLNKILEITDGKPIYFTGETGYKQSCLSIGNISFTDTVTIKTEPAGYFGYKLVYDITLAKDCYPEFHHTPKQGCYYLVPAKFAKVNNDDILYKIDHSYWVWSDIYLFYKD